MLMNLHSGRASVAMLRMMGCANGRAARHLLHSDCVVDEKTVVLQKKENEGFGFVLRGAKADTPIEEFTPTSAFPALQYLESVDEGGVAWQAGLRTGDFLIEVGVASSSSRSLLSLQMLSPPPPKRAPTTALSMRSKSMTSELEELDKVEEMTHAQKASPVDTKIATIKPRPSSRCLVTTTDMNVGKTWQRFGINKHVSSNENKANIWQPEHRNTTLPPQETSSSFPFLCVLLFFYK
uniref:PDZ domain-containing protein n=1 Tax=Oryzias sinensis TaxID=183150 RepID=A0A8C7Z6C0_9TELE